MKLFTFLLWLFLPPFFTLVDNTYQTPPFSQDWSNTGLITTDGDWSGVPGIIGYRGDGLTGGTGTDPQTILADGTTTPINVEANETNPNTFTTGGVAEFHLMDPVVALTGSGTADAPFILLHLNTSGYENIKISYNLRDLDGSTDNAIQPVALHYRIGNTGNFTNLPGGYVADATTGPSQATLVTPVSVMLPANAADQPQLQIRIMTTNAVGNDEWVGIDDIVVMGDEIQMACSITSVTVGNISACNDNGTPDPSDDFFTADVTVAYSNPPVQGTLNVSGDGTASIAVQGLGQGIHTFTGVTMSADGSAISLTAAFSADGACTLTNANAGTAPAACSVAPCDITDISVDNISDCDDNGTPVPDDDIFFADVTVTFVNPPATGFLELTEGADESVDVSMLDGPTSHTFVGVMMYTDGFPINLMASFTAVPGCEYYEGEIDEKPEPCSCGPVINEVDYDQPGTDHAEFIELYNGCPVAIDLSDYNVELINGGNGTPYQSIDLPAVMLAPGEYFVLCLDNTTTPNCDMEVLNSIQNGSPDAISLMFMNEGQVDGISYEGDVPDVTEGSGAGLDDDGSVEAQGLSRFPDGNDTNWNDDDFSLRCATPGAANSSSTSNCLNCGISSITVDNISSCDDNGTSDPSDDVFLANVTVTFTERPNTGTLNLTGDGTASISVTGLNSPHTFVAVVFSADGSDISLNASFSALPTCSLMVANAGTAPSACSMAAQCSISSLNVTNISACNSQGTSNPADDTFTADVTVAFDNAPANGTLDLTGDGTGSVSVVGLTSPYTFTGVTMPADGSAISLNAAFSADPACSISDANAGTAPAACSQCSVSSLIVTNISGCNSQGSGDPADDTFTADVTVAFGNPPASGTLDLTGDGTGSVSVVGLTSPHTFTSVTMAADGSAISLNAAFSADPACTLANANAGMAPASCSQCSISDIILSNISSCDDNGTADPSDDTFTADVTVNYANPPFPGTIQLSGDASAVVAVGNGSSSHMFGGVVFSADGGPISLTADFLENQACSFTNNNLGMAPASCSPCNITGISLSNVSSCNDNGTANPADDYFTADITVSFLNPPASGVLSLTGDGLGVVSVVGLGSSYTFQNVQMVADGGAVSLTAAFSANPACSFSNTNAGMAPASCSPCGIESIVLSNVSACDNQFTLDPSDDTFMADVTVTYFQAPGSGSVDISGDAMASAMNFGPNSHVFYGLTFSADGTPINLTASFSADPACSLTEVVGTAPFNCSGDCFLEITDIIVENQSCPGAADGSITIVVNSSPGQIGYSIDGGANFVLDSVFYQVAPGTYPILVQVFGDPTCSDTGTVTVLPAPPSAMQTWYKDYDGDFHSDGVTVLACEQPAGYQLAASLLSLDGDCNDYDSFEFPGQTWYKDTDGDGYSDGTVLVQCTQPVGYAAAANLTATTGDCNDNNPAINPGASELCNGIDDDCNGMVDDNAAGGLTYNGNVVFSTQAQVDAFSDCYSIINGNLTIQFAGIVNLDNLINLVAVTGNVTIKQTSLTDLGGLDSLTTIGGTLSIFYNSKLVTLDGLEALSAVGGNLSIYFNLKLTDCCAIYDLINNSGVGGSIAIFNNKTGCDNVAQINAACSNSNLLAPPVGGQGSLAGEIAMQSVELFPNPAAEVLNVRLSQPFESAQVRLFDLQGRLVSQSTMTGGNTAQMEVSHLTEGTYMVQVLVDGENFAQRIVVE